MRTVTGVLSALALAGLTTFAAVDATAQDRVRMKMHSAFAGNLPILGPAGKRIVTTAEEISNRTLQLRFYEPGALVPAIGYMDSLSEGALEAVYSTPGFDVAKEPAVAFFAAVPFGPGFGEYLAWFDYGGGNELMDGIYSGWGVKAQICGVIPPEASGWFRQPINSVEELRGLKMRFFGLGAKVMEKFGVSTQLLAAGDIYPALELGTIDATEFSMPAMDEGLGFFQVAKHYYFPGWHQQATTNELLLNAKTYEGLSQWHKDVLRVTCGYNKYAEFVEGEAKQGPAIDAMRSKGVTIHQWPAEAIDKFEAAWKEVAAEEAQKSEVFARIWDSYNAYREKYASWKELGYLK